MLAPVLEPALILAEDWPALASVLLPVPVPVPVIAPAPASVPAPASLLSAVGVFRCLGLRSFRRCLALSLY